MLITIKAPEKAVKFLYVEINEDGWESEPKPVTIGMITKIEQEEKE